MEGGLTLAGFPQCQKCNQGVLIPLSDFGQDGAPILYKAWVCTHLDCGFHIRIDRGEISIGKTIRPSTR